MAKVHPPGRYAENVSNNPPVNRDAVPAGLCIPGTDDPEVGAFVEIRTPGP